MSVTDSWPIVRSGTWLYAGVAPVGVRVLLSPETWGSGDHEDDESIRDGSPVECYCLAYEMAGAPGNFSNVVMNLATLADALACAESKFPGIQWRAE
jgi:hypothetical protein